MTFLRYPNFLRSFFTIGPEAGRSGRDIATKAGMLHITLAISTIESIQLFSTIFFR